MAEPRPQQPTSGPEPITEMDVSTPTLRWVTIEGPGGSIPIGEGDDVLDSYYNPQYDAWEVLVLVKPEESGQSGEREGEQGERTGQAE